MFLTLTVVFPIPNINALEIYSWKLMKTILVSVIF